MKRFSPPWLTLLLGTLCALELGGCKPAENPDLGPPGDAGSTSATGEAGSRLASPEKSPAEGGDGAPNAGAPGQAALPEPPPQPEPEPIDTNAKVAILGYHRFSETADISRRLLPTTIYVEKFRAQMQTLVDNEIPVIALGDFLAWRRGEKNIPPFSIIITIDDGWKSTHTLALPVLKDFGFPFTVYLYANFLNSGGKTLTLEQIQEMVDAGGEIGSHSVSHADLRKQGRRTDEMQVAYLREETAGSRRILREKLGIDPKTFSYPYGVYNEKVIQAAVEAGYEAMVTVRGQKVGWETDLREVGRYIIHGEDDRAFDWAVSSRLPGGIASAHNILKETAVDETTGEETPLVQVEPADDSRVTDRRPLIKAHLSQLEGIDPDSVKMAIDGLGEVRATYDAENQMVSYRPVQRLRLPEYWVQVEFQREGEKKPDIMRWKFIIDHIAHYRELAPPTSPSPRKEAKSDPSGAPPQPPSTPETAAPSISAEVSNPAS